MKENRTRKFYEVDVRNRVVKGVLETRIRGTQGKWYPETLYYLAESEQEAKEVVKTLTDSRFFLGVKKQTRQLLK